MKSIVRNVFSANDMNKQRQFDEVCGIAFVNLYTLTKANDDGVVLGPFDHNNDEHMFLLGVAKGFAGAYSKRVYLDVPKRVLRKLNRGIEKECRYLHISKNTTSHPIDPDKLLNFMREAAEDICGEGFTFGEIYHYYYARKD